MNGVGGTVGWEGWEAWWSGRRGVVGDEGREGRGGAIRGYPSTLFCYREMLPVMTSWQTRPRLAQLAICSETSSYEEAWREKIGFPLRNRTNKANFGSVS